MKRQRTTAPRVLALAAALGLGTYTAAAGAGEAALQDNCAMCHDKPPVPASHVPVPDRKVATCTQCHAAIGSRALLLAVHGKHLEMGLPCANCHMGQVPERGALDAALQAARGPDG